MIGGLCITKIIRTLVPDFGTMTVEGYEKT